MIDPRFTAWPAGVGLLVLVSCELEWLASDRFLSYAFSGWIGVGLSMGLLLAAPSAAWLSAALLRSWRLRGPSPWLLGWPFFGFLALILVPVSSIGVSSITESTASSNGTNPPWLDRWLRGRAIYWVAGLFSFHLVGALTMGSLVYGCVQVGQQAAPLVFLVGLHTVVFRGLARLGSCGLVLRSEARAALRVAPWCSLVPVVGGIAALLSLCVLDEAARLGLVGRVYRGRHAARSAGRYRAGVGGRRFGHRARGRLRLERLLFARSLLLVSEVALWSGLAVRWLPSVAIPARDALVILSASWAGLGGLIWIASRWRERWGPVHRFSGWLATTQVAALAGYTLLEPAFPLFWLVIAFWLQVLANFYATLCTTRGEAELNRAAGERIGVLVALSVVVLGGMIGVGSISWRAFSNSRACWRFRSGGSARAGRSARAGSRCRWRRWPFPWSWRYRSERSSTRRRITTRCAACSVGAGDSRGDVPSRADGLAPRPLRLCGGRSRGTCRGRDGTS